MTTGNRHSQVYNFSRFRLRLKNVKEFAILARIHIYLGGFHLKNSTGAQSIINFFFFFIFIELKFISFLSFFFFKRTIMHDYHTEVNQYDLIKRISATIETTKELLLKIYIYFDRVFNFCVTHLMSGSSSHFHSNRGVKRKNNDIFPFLLIKVIFRVSTIICCFFNLLKTT